MKPLIQEVIILDTLRINDLHADGKIFDKVSRIDATSELKQFELIFDMNSEIFPLQKSRIYSFAIVKNLGAIPGHKYDPDQYNPELLSHSKLYNDYEYIMHGQIFRYEPQGTQIQITASFGGLLLKIKGPVSQLGSLKMDDKIQFLLRQ